jgi:hypothetical protein
MLKSGNDYELGWLPVTDLSSLQDSFENLPPDNYVNSRLRSRCYSCYRYQDGELTHLPGKDFMQTKDINKALGDVERKYEEIDDSLRTNPVFLRMFEEFVQRTGITGESVIEAHQIRWHCHAHIKEVAPEGTHQDGFDYVSVYMVSTYNVDGGEMILYRDVDKPPFLKKQLGDGEFLLLNDRKVFHNAAPLVPTPNEQDGHWDVIVLTASRV